MGRIKVSHRTRNILVKERWLGVCMCHAVHMCCVVKVALRSKGTLLVSRTCVMTRSYCQGSWLWVEDEQTSLKCCLFTHLDRNDENIPASIDRTANNVMPVPGRQYLVFIAL